MSAQRRTLQIIHFSSTGLFLASVGYLLVFALRQGGAQWWLIFSLGGVSAVIAFVLVSVYLFAIFRGVVRSQQPAIEHPLTSSMSYMVFYDIVPFLGAAGGVIGMFGTIDVNEFFLGVSYNTLIATFFVWIVLDPAIGLLEYVLPAGRSHRSVRLAQAKAERERKEREQQALLADVQAKMANERTRWQEILQPQARQLAGLVSAEDRDQHRAEAEAVDMGVRAWQTGGLGCMEQLYRMAIDIYRQRCSKDTLGIDTISRWWDGIGGWRSEKFVGPKPV